MTTWQSLFERGADYDADADDVREALTAHRGDATENDE